MMLASMCVWRKALIFCGLVGLLSAGSARGGAVPGQFSDELDTDHYDCLLTLQPATTLAADRVITLALETGHGAQDVRCEISRATIRLSENSHGVSRMIGEVASQVVPGTAYDLTLIRRGTALALYHNHARLLHGTAAKGTGTLATLSAGTGWSVTSARIQRLEPVDFADDFMRAADDETTALGKWINVSGHWALQSAWDKLPRGENNKFASSVFAENPFAWIGNSQDAIPAICTTGEADWEDYTFNVAVNPDAHGAVGVLANLADAHNGLLVRWSPANDHGTAGNLLALYRLENGKRTLLASSPGGYLPGQWYRMTVISTLEGVRVSIDGRERLTHDAGDLWRGGIGLYSEGKVGSVFDDVTVYGHALDTDLLREMRQSHVNQKFIFDDKGMQEWAVQPERWQPDANVPDLYWYPETVYGDHTWVYATINPVGHAAGAVQLMLHWNPAAPLTSGYRAVISVDGPTSRWHYTLYRGNVQLAAATVAPPAADTDYSLRLTHFGTTISLLLDDTPVLRVTDAQPLTAGKAGYYLKGQTFRRTTEVHAMSQNMLDYTFAEEPADWYAVGTWLPSVRWACTPTWSFLGGWSRGDAVLWHKGAFTGDQSLEAFMGEMMEYPRERDDYMAIRYQGYFAVTLCGDGQDPSSGYCGIFGAPGTDGTPHQRIVLLRNGIEVGSAPYTHHGWWENHREWFDLRLEKQGNTVSFTIKRGWDRYNLSYTDKQPLAGGIPAIWTRNNAVSVPRVRINCANAPAPRTDPQVYLDTPWYPEWANVGQTETVHFADGCSASGQPVVLRVTPRDIPPADNTAAIAVGTDVRFTPASAGDHWYQVVATDGAHTSPPFHLDQTVFNPALGRDDSHALVLYRFDEGHGGTVHDYSPITPPQDLVLPAETNTVQWLPGQGLSLHSPHPLTTSGGDKLIALAKTKACTIEFWISTDTIYLPYTLFSWGDKLTINHYRNNIHVVTPGFQNEQNVDGDGIFYRLRIGLQHYVITWDGTTTRCYCNGTPGGQHEIPWEPEGWQGTHPFALGADYPGTYYLFAIHDRCFTEAEVMRHYKAGPSAK